MDQQPTFIGMDLGTFKTSIASSNGRRDVVPSAVGWAKDHVARAMLGRDVVFGSDLTKYRLALNVVRPFQRGALKYLDHVEGGVAADKVDKHKQAARLLVQHAVSLTQPPTGAPVYGVIGAPSRANLLNKKVLLEAAAESFDAVVIVPEPFTVAYGMNSLTNTVIVDIGAGTTDICPMHGTYPREEDQVTIPLGGDAIDDEFARRLTELYPQAQVSPNILREIKEKHGFVHDVNEQAVVSLSVKGRPTEFNVTEPLKAACQILVEPIVEGLLEVIGQCDPEFQKAMRENVVLAGGGSQLNGLDQLVETALEPYGGGSVRRVADSLFAGAAGALKLAMHMPPEYWQQLQHVEVRRAA